MNNNVSSCLSTITHSNGVAGVHLASGAFLLGIGSESGAGPSPYPHDAAAVSAMAVKARHCLWFSKSLRNQCQMHSNACELIEGIEMN